MSTLKADTIVASDGTSPVTLTKQEATKHWVNYDAANATTDGSLNQSSLTDHATGIFSSTFTNAFSSATNRCHTFGAWNSYDDGSNPMSTVNRGNVTCHQHEDAVTASAVKYHFRYNSSSTANGGDYDVSANYCMSVGDLA